MEILKSEEKSVFEVLSNINVNKYVQKKNNLSFLSWAHAWGEVKKHFPKASYKIYEDKAGCFYHTDEITCWVKVSVTIENLEHIEYLPIMNFRNQSIPRNDVTSFDVNKTIQRALTKALARHGLGLYIYAGEDLPEIENTKIENHQISKLLETIREFDDNDLLVKILKKFKASSVQNLSKKQYEEIMDGLSKIPKQEDKSED